MTNFQIRVPEEAVLYFKLVYYICNKVVNYKKI